MVAFLWMNVKLAGPQQPYGWFWAHREHMLTKLQTLAVLWMILGLEKISKTTKLLDLSSFMDGFGPIEKNYNKTAGPRQFYGWF